MPAKSLVEFILYIVPGFIALQVYRERYPARRVSQFTEITTSVAYGVLIYAGVTWVDTSLLSRALQGQAQASPGIWFIASLFGVAYLLGKLRIAVRSGRYKLAEKFPTIRVLAPRHHRHQSIWPLVNAETNRDWAVVFLHDGSIYMGGIEYYTFDPNAENQDFLLTEARRVDEMLKEIYLVDGIGIYMNTRDVSRIEFIRSQRGG